MNHLNVWFEENKRSFPWRKNPTPYAVWISEVMLQQTRAQVVIPYFEKWMEKFPDVETLSKAPVEEVIKIWEGLGYYSRARNLHAGAKEIVEKFGGKIPSTREQLLQIRGLGPYTVAAILSFGFRKRAAPVDGNVLRVASRFFLVEEEIEKSSTRKKIESLVEDKLDPMSPWITGEALIELGATICLPKPRCAECPLLKECKAALQGNPERLPNKKVPIEATELIRGVAVIEAEGMVLVRKNRPGEIMADLYEFPYFEGVHLPREVSKEIEKMVGSKIYRSSKLPRVKHTFTRYRAILIPRHFQIAKKSEVVGFEWRPVGELLSLPFSSGHRKILKHRCNFWASCGLLDSHEHTAS